MMIFKGSLGAIVVSTIVVAAPVAIVDPQVHNLSCAGYATSSYHTSSNSASTRHRPPSDNLGAFGTDASGLSNISFTQLDGMDQLAGMDESDWLNLASAVRSSGGAGFDDPAKSWPISGADTSSDLHDLLHPNSGGSRAWAGRVITLTTRLADTDNPDDARGLIDQLAAAGVSTSGRPDDAQRTRPSDLCATKPGQGTTDTGDGASETSSDQRRSASDSDQPAENSDTSGDRGDSGLSDSDDTGDRNAPGSAPQAPAPVVASAPPAPVPAAPPKAAPAPKAAPNPPPAPPAAPQPAAKPEPEPATSQFNGALDKIDPEHAPHVAQPPAPNAAAIGGAEKLFK